MNELEIREKVSVIYLYVSRKRCDYLETATT